MSETLSDKSRSNAKAGSDATTSERPSANSSKGSKSRHKSKQRTSRPIRAAGRSRSPSSETVSHFASEVASVLPSCLEDVASHLPDDPVQGLADRLYQSVDVRLKQSAERQARMDSLRVSNIIGESRENRTKELHDIRDKVSQLQGMLSRDKGTNAQSERRNNNKLSFDEMMTRFRERRHSFVVNQVKKLIEEGKVHTKIRIVPNPNRKRRDKNEETGKSNVGDVQEELGEEGEEEDFDDDENGSFTDYYDEFHIVKDRNGRPCRIRVKEESLRESLELSRGHSDMQEISAGGDGKINNESVSELASGEPKPSDTELEKPPRKPLSKSASQTDKLHPRWRDSKKSSDTDIVVTEPSRKLSHKESDVAHPSDIQPSKTSSTSLKGLYVPVKNFRRSSDPEETLTNLLKLKESSQTAYHSALLLEESDDLLNFFAALNQRQEVVENLGTMVEELEDKDEDMPVEDQDMFKRRDSLLYQGAALLEHTPGIDDPSQLPHIKNVIESMIALEDQLISRLDELRAKEREKQTEEVVPTPKEREKQTEAVVPTPKELDVVVPVEKVSSTRAPSDRSTSLVKNKVPKKEPEGPKKRGSSKFWSKPLAEMREKLVELKDINKKLSEGVNVPLVVDEKSLRSSLDSQKRSSSVKTAGPEKQSQTPLLGSLSKLDNLEFICQREYMSELYTVCEPPDTDKSYDYWGVEPMTLLDYNITDPLEIYPATTIDLNYPNDTINTKQILMEANLI